MQTLLAARAPLYARTPWSFIKLDDRAEGGMPHTRGAHIVMPRETVEAYAKMHRESSANGTLAGFGFLLHANPTAHELNVAYAPWPNVPRAPLRATLMKRHGARVDDGEDIARSAAG